MKVAISVVTSLGVTIKIFPLQNVQLSYIYYPLSELITIALLRPSTSLNLSIKFKIRLYFNN